LLLIVCSSASDSLLQVFGVPRALHRDLGDGAVHFAEIVGTQFDASRSDILLKPMQPWFREAKRSTASERAGTRRCRVFPGCDFAEQIDQPWFACRASGVKRGTMLRTSVLSKIRVLVDRTGK
jgi:hypothetical protein